MKIQLLTLALVVALPLHAHEPVDKAAPVPSAAAATDPATKAAMAVVDQFGVALKAADMATVGKLLDERVLILESGGAERSRDEYLGHHAISDAAFLGGATITPKRRSGEAVGDTAWFGSESEIRTGQGSEAKTVLSTETMVLKRRAGQWRIVHIHWSSRPKKAAP